MFTPWGALIGGIGGGIAGGLAHAKMKDGGIIPEGFKNDTFRANLSSNEAVIPLDSDRGKNILTDFIGNLKNKDEKNKIISPFNINDLPIKNEITFDSKNRNILTDFIGNLKNKDEKNGEIIPKKFDKTTFEVKYPKVEEKITLDSEKGQNIINQIVGDNSKIIEAIKNIPLQLTVKITNKEDGRDKTFKKNARLSSDLVLA